MDRLKISKEIFKFLFVRIYRKNNDQVYLCVD